MDRVILKRARELLAERGDLVAAPDGPSAGKAGHYGGAVEPAEPEHQPSSSHAIIL